MPTALAALSPPPPATITPAGRPQRAASSGRSVPEASLPSTSRGICASVRPQAASTSADQRRSATSSHSVPAASLISPTRSPVSMKRSQSLGSSTVAVRAKTSGSCRRTHSSFGAVKPGMARLPAIACRRGQAASSSAHSAPLRPSFHRMAGRSTSPAASISTAPCIWPDRPIARTCASAAACPACSRAIARVIASHQSAGDCSLCKGAGRCTVSRSPTLATRRCCRSSSTSFSSEVPRSMPRYMGKGPAERLRPRRRSGCRPACGTRSASAP